MNYWYLSLLLCFTLCLSQSQVQVHVSLGSTPGLISFVWSNRIATPTSVVRVVTPTDWIYYSGSASSFVDGNNSWSISTVQAQLSVGGSYTYQVGCNVTGFSSSFQLQVPVDSSPSTFFMYGDLATEFVGKPSWSDIQAIAKSYGAQAIVQAGDMAYNLCSNSSTWGDLFMQDLQPVASYVPYQVCAGNHEAVDSYVNYLARFAMPGAKLYYTFTLGYVRFLAIHTEAFLTETDLLPDMMSFIKSVLNRSAEDRAKYPWMVVFGHRPMYCMSLDKAKTCGKEATTIKSYMEAMMNQYDVDLYISGHEHNYQRSAPVYQGNIVGPSTGNLFVNPTAPIYIVTGGAGNDGPNDPVTMSGAPVWTISVQQDLSFSMITTNSTHLVWKQLLSANNTISDAFTIIKTQSTFLSSS